MNLSVIPFDPRPTADPQGPESLQEQEGGWIARAADGDLRAFDHLMRLYERKVMSIARQLVGPDDAQDVAQEVFLRLYRSLKRIDPERGLGGWLYRVTVNASRDMKRNRKGQQLQPLDASNAEQIPAEDLASDPWRKTAWSAEQALLEEALSTLKEKERQALVLRDLQGLPCARVAQLLNVSEVTVRSHISRARLKIRAFCERRRTQNLPPAPQAPRTRP